MFRYYQSSNAYRLSSSKSDFLDPVHKFLVYLLLCANDFVLLGDFKMNLLKDISFSFGLSVNLRQIVIEALELQQYLKR